MEGGIFFSLLVIYICAVFTGDAMYKFYLFIYLVMRAVRPLFEQNLAV